jgi:hypothetical protein
MKSKGLIWATLGLVVIVGLLVHRSYRLNQPGQPREPKVDPHKNALAVEALPFQPIDRASYDQGYKAAGNAAKSTDATAPTPADWTSYWLGYEEEKRAQAHGNPHTGKILDALHDDQRCIQGEVLTVRATAYAKTKDTSGNIFLCSGDKVLPPRD